VRGVLAVGVFDERGTRLAVCGHAPALAALSFADANPSFASGIDPDDDAVIEHEEFVGGRVVTVPLELGVLEIVLDACTDRIDPMFPIQVGAATHALNVVFEAMNDSSIFDDFGSQGPNSETVPCFVRPPGF
jgi:hypothetical protein